MKQNSAHKIMIHKYNKHLNRCVHLVVTGGWCWFVMREQYCWLAGSWWLVASGWCWFNMREQYCWLVGWQAKRTERISFTLTRYAFLARHTELDLVPSFLLRSDILTDGLENETVKHFRRSVRLNMHTYLFKYICFTLLYFSHFYGIGGFCHNSLQMRGLFFF